MTRKDACNTRSYQTDGSEDGQIERLVRLLDACIGWGRAHQKHLFGLGFKELNMGRMPRTRKAYVLSKRVKYEDTKPEQVIKGILFSDGFLPPETNVLCNKRITVGNWTINPDFYVFLAPPIIVEVDGVYHDTPTQQKKTKWRDGLLTQAGYRVIHVDAELTKNKAYQTYLKDKLAMAILSPEKVVRIDA